MFVKNNMKKINELHIPGGVETFKHLAHALLPYHTKAVGSLLFVVEGTLKKPRIGIRYPGYKLKQRTLKKPNKNSALLADLFDFEVIPFEKGREFMQLIFLWFCSVVRFLRQVFSVRHRNAN